MNNVVKQLLERPLVPVFYHSDIEICHRVFEACYAGGVRVFEFTNRGSNALANFQALIQRQQDKFTDCYVGIGTIMDKDAAEQFINAGASFVVSPYFSPVVAEVCLQHEVPYIPGCMTVKEIAEANEMGCSLVKIFPGEVVGMPFVKAAKAVLPNIKMMITGGVSKANANDWFTAGADAVGIGSQVIKISDQKEMMNLQQTIKELFAALYRNKKG
ncbi:bifunctional 4-hydroxy-2-oxoglutarate aldolase/2-dehydro-3-deoxy-phosphogluconate aldolase [soil metagenome]